MKGEGTVKLDILDDFRQELVRKNLTLRFTASQPSVQDLVVRHHLPEIVRLLGDSSFVNANLSMASSLNERWSSVAHIDLVASDEIALIPGTCVRAPTVAVVYGGTAGALSPSPSAMGGRGDEHTPVESGDTAAACNDTTSAQSSAVDISILVERTATSGTPGTSPFAKPPPDVPQFGASQPLAVAAGITQCLQ